MDRDGLALKIKLMGYSVRHWLSDNTLIVSRGDGVRVVSITPTDEVVFSKPYNKIESIPNAKIIGVNERNSSMWGAINSSCQLVVKPVYERYRNLTCEIAELRSGSICFVVNSTGATILPAIYKKVCQLFETPYGLVLEVITGQSKRNVYIYDKGKSVRTEVIADWVEPNILDEHLIYCKNDKSKLFESLNLRTLDIEGPVEFSVEDKLIKFLNTDNIIQIHSIYKRSPNI